MKLKILFGLLFICNFSFGQTQMIKKLDGSEISAIEIDKIVSKLMDTAKVHGLNLAILNNNKTVYANSYGYKNIVKKELLDTNSVMQAASFTKTIFAYLSMLLIQDNVIELDKPLYQYLQKPIPDYEYFMPLNGDERWKLITARMCLSHTTGLPNSRYINVKTGALDTTDKMKIYFEPGKQYAYSGEGLKLLQLVEEEITKKTIEELAVEKVFKPIGMTMTSFIWQQRFEANLAIGHLENGQLNPKKKRNVPIAGGNLLTTITDYAKFVAYLTESKELSKKYSKIMFAPQIEITSKFQFPTMLDETTISNKEINLSYGLGVGLLKSKYGRAFFKEGHDDAWRNYFINFYDKGISLIIMTNSANSEYIYKELLEKIIGDIYTPFHWHRYFPYETKTN